MEEDFSYVVLVTNCIAIIAFIGFLITLFCVKDKSYGLYIIMILNVSYMLYSLLDIYRAILINSENEVHISDFISRWIYDFGLFWAASFSIFTYTLMKDPMQFFDYKKFMIKAFLGCMMMASVYPLV